MMLGNLLILALTGSLLGITIRNLFGRPSIIGIRSGWVAMIGFAAMAAWCFWKAREFGQSASTAGAQVAAQKFMTLYLIGLLLSAYAVTRQRRGLRKPPPPGGAPPPPDVS
jgi:hypothetical protein